MRSGRAAMVAVIVGSVLASCSSSTVTRPDFLEFQAVGVLGGIEEFETRTVYTLADGRKWDRPNDQFRVAYDMPAAQTLFVAGQDKDGAFVLLIGGQQGLPADCPYSLRYGGREWGDAIESQGFAWHKAGSFAGLADNPAVGAEYPGNTLFCLDADAEVTAALQAIPDSSDDAPQQSATAP